MTKNELFDGVRSNDVKLMKHDNNRDVAFWPTAIGLKDTGVELNGIWYSLVMGDMMGDGNGQPLRETIKIKDADLPGWKWINIPGDDK